MKRFHSLDALKNEHASCLAKLKRQAADQLGAMGRSPTGRDPGTCTAAKFATVPEYPIGHEMTWEEFKDEILIRRNSYKGVFIQDIIIDWHVPLYQRPQHIASAMGALGYLVVYRTNNNGYDTVDGFVHIAPNVWLTNSPNVDSLEGCVRSIYSTLNPFDDAQLRLRAERSILVYEYIDHIDPQISGGPENIKRLLELKQFAFSGGVDYIVASSTALYDEAAGAVGHDRVLLVPNGVDTTHYRSQSGKDVTLPRKVVSFASRHRTCVGYFGAMAPWLWHEAINELISMRPDLGFIFIGPDYNGGAELIRQTDNCLHVGPIPYRVLPIYAQLFDVAFIPFRPGDIAHTTSPLKLFEYFALETPVVVTSCMTECIQYPEVFAGSSPTELSSAIDRAALQRDSSEHKQRLRSLADRNSWVERAKVYALTFGHPTTVQAAQSLIRDCHRMDNRGKTYYDTLKSTGVA